MEFTVSMVQMRCIEGKREENFHRAKELLREYKEGPGVNFIVLPELFAVGFRHEDYNRVGQGIPGPTAEFLSEVAGSLGAYVVASDVERGGERFYNTLAVAEPSGGIRGTYRKIHPFQEERDVFEGGDTLAMFNCDGIRVGVQICYDIRFPEVSRKLALEGAELILIPAAFPDPRSAHWNVLVQARAVENQLYVAATNRIGWGFDKKTYFGHSQMVDPWGLVLSRRNTEERLVKAQGDTSMIESVRRQITCYKDRAPSGYDKVKWF
jgi:omega-amidase